MRERGSAMVELAFALAVLVPLLAGVVAYGSMWFQLAELQSAVRAGARYGSCLRIMSGAPEAEEGFRRAVRNATVFGNPEGVGPPLIPRLTPEQVEVTVKWERAAPDQIRVGIRSYSFAMRIPGLSMDLPWAEFPYAGEYAPAE